MENGGLCEYELYRRRNILKNRRVMVDLGLLNKEAIAGTFTMMMLLVYVVLITMILMNRAASGGPEGVEFIIPRLGW